MQAVREAALAGDETAEERRRTEEYLEARPVNDRIPACVDLRAGPGNRVWVRAYASSWSSPGVWYVFRDGRLSYTIRLPEKSFLVALGIDRLAVVQLDELEVEHVRVYAVPSSRP